MGSWSSALVPRIAAFVVLGLSATATLTWAAETRLTVASPSKAPAVAQQLTVIVVPDVRGQAYVFAEGILEDNGFAWRVPGANGFAANTVVGQSPLPGTRVVDTGAPAVTLTLGRNASYPQRGTPVNASPFAATAIRLASEAAVTAPHVPVVTPKPAATPKPAVAPKAAKSVVSTKRAVRTPDFVVLGAPKEPQKEMPLVQRARLLGTWLSTHRTKSPANVQHWMYQHAWIVTGAKFGWWHGADALKVLIQDDLRAQTLWGVGSRSESAARAALAAVGAKSK
jgi:hypothetical protein